MPQNATDSENLAQLVSVGHKIREAAEAIGVPEHAAYKLSCKPEFKRRVSEIRTERTEGLSAQALGAAELGFNVALSVMQDDSQKASDRLAAVKLVFSQVLPLAENTELRRRLDDLERGAAETAGET